MSLTLPVLPETSVPPAEGAPQPLPGILDVPTDTLRAWLAERRQPPMRISQIRKQILANRATAFEDMSDLPKDLRPELAGSFSVFSTKVEKHMFAMSDDTHKLVLRLADDKMIECVLIQEDGRATACVSTQVGCGMGCVFCASGLNGVVRNLTVGEIVEQLVRLRNLTNPTSTNPDRAPRLTHIVVMGMGEPLANLDRLLEALAVAGDKHGLCVGQRHVTISTVGLPAKIRQLADVGKQYHLAVSLHAPTDALRTQIVPTNDKTGIPAILEAADYFYEKTGRQVTYEYVVLGGTNDDPTHAKELARLLAGRKAHVNLIPWNDVEGLPYRRPVEGNLQGMIETLHRSGISVKVRKRKGAEIDAACGQLRRQLEGSGERGEGRAKIGEPIT
ncbi:MAG: 23S rRNA (adenine(2503)-C(2))-methyltransferase RlmN [Planctomycetaceae bacterium]|nr:23S rRNA (adenine(2503)-C(2))-methyltransferase RlmN [Planctomycetaceae bacterium]